MEKIIRRVQFPPKPIPTINVAAYARVSSDKDAMLHSLSEQVSYYNGYIQKHPGWKFCGVYADEAKTGTKDTRANFQRMLSDCRAGKIDLIITKSISRFARNTVTLLQTARELKAMGIDIFFEEQNLHSNSPAGEFVMTVLASVAQEESRSTSENMKWRIRKNFEEGMPWSGTMLGYRMRDGQLVVDDEEAQLWGMSPLPGGSTRRGMSPALVIRGVGTALQKSFGTTPTPEICSSRRPSGKTTLQRNSSETTGSCPSTTL